MDVIRMGVRSVTFNGNRLSSGVYTCRLTAGGVSEARKILLVR